MKRPFAVIGFTLFGVLLTLSLADSNITAYCVLFMSTLIGMLTLSKKNLRQALTLPVLFFTVATACLLFLNFNTRKQAVQSLTGDYVKVEGVVAEAPYAKNGNGRHYCVLELDSVEGTKVKARLRLSFSPQNDCIDERELTVGSNISFSGKVYVPGESEKSISRYFTGENILLGAYTARNVSITEQTRKSISYLFENIRSFVSDRLRYCFGDKVAGLLIGILTGEKDCLDAEIYSSLRRTGTAHLMAVSGLHLSMWVFVLGALITQKRRNEKLRTLLLMLSVIFIMLLAGMSESVKRAGFMSLVYLCAKLINKESDSLNSLGFAVTVMLLYNPSSVLSISLQLSFLSTLGILTLGKHCLERSEVIFGGKRINSTVKKLLRFISDMFIISISVLVFTLPVLIYSFGGFSSVTVWVNMLVSPAVIPLLVLSGLCTVLSYLPFAAYPLMLAVKLVSGYVIVLTDFFAEIKNSFILFKAENTLLLLSAAVIIITVGIVLICGNFAKRTPLTVCSLLLTVALIISGKALSHESIKLHLSAYEDNFAVAVQISRNALIFTDADSYEKRLFISALEDKGIDRLYELNGTVKSLADGKHISEDEHGELFGLFSSDGRVTDKILLPYGKYIHIFYGEALQSADCCDIIIQILANDVTVITADKQLSLKEEKVIEIDI